MPFPLLNFQQFQIKLGWKKWWGGKSSSILVWVTPPFSPQPLLFPTSTSTRILVDPTNPPPTIIRLPFQQTTVRNRPSFQRTPVFCTPTLALLLNGLNKGHPERLKWAREYKGNESATMATIPTIDCMYILKESTKYVSIHCTNTQYQIPEQRPAAASKGAWSWCAPWRNQPNIFQFTIQSWIPEQRPTAPSTKGAWSWCAPWRNQPNIFQLTVSSLDTGYRSSAPLLCLREVEVGMYLDPQAVGHFWIERRYRIQCPHNFAHITQLLRRNLQSTYCRVTGTFTRVTSFTVSTNMFAATQIRWQFCRTVPTNDERNRLNICSWRYGSHVPCW